MSSSDNPAKVWRPWRFSLRFLLLVTFGVAAFFGGWQANEYAHRAKPEPVKIRLVPLPTLPAPPIQQHIQEINRRGLLDKVDTIERQKRTGFEQYQQRTAP
jgi:hypothetical protein